VVRKTSILGLSLGLERGETLRWSKGDFLVVFGEGVGIHAAIMHDSPIKEPGGPKRT